MRFETDEGREKRSRKHTSRHTSPADGELADSRKAPSSSSVEGSLPSSRKKYFDCQKTKGAGFKLPREAARSFNSLELVLRFGSGRPLPLYYCLILRLFMDLCCPSLPLKILVVDEFRATEHTTIYVAACRCHRIDCSLCVLLINIKVTLHHAQSSSRGLFCIKYQ